MKGKTLSDSRFTVGCKTGLHQTHIDGHLLRGAVESIRYPVPPIPAEDAFYGHEHIRHIGLDGVVEMVDVGRKVPVETCSAILVDDADVHRPCVKIDSGVELMVLRVESHVASS